MNLTNRNDNRHFWKNVKPFLSDKGSYNPKIIFVNKDKVISDTENVHVSDRKRSVNFLEVL